MYTLKLKHHFDASHCLKLDYDSPCLNVHGHRWEVIITIRTHELDQNGMIVDFKKLKAVINELDHCSLNDKLSFNTTAENISKYFYDKIVELDPERFGLCEVEVLESPGASITYSL